MTLTNTIPLSTRIQHIPAFVVPDSPLPKLGRVHFDELAFEYMAIDDYDRVWWGGTPHQVRAAFAADIARICENARKSGFTLQEECDMLIDECTAANRPERPPY